MSVFYRTLVIKLKNTGKEHGRSTGTVTLVEVGFKLSNNGIEIAVSIDGRGITLISEKIILDKGAGEVTPGTITPGSPPNQPSGGGSVSGTYRTQYSDSSGSGSGAITFSGSNFTMTGSGTAIGMSITITIKGTYTVSGTTITCTMTSASIKPPELEQLLGFKPGDTQTFTIVDAKTIRDDTDGTVWTK